MRLLITGAAGFVGSHLTQYLKSQGDEVIETSFPANGKIELDICNAEQSKNVIAEYQPDVVIHLAAIAFVPLAEKDFSKALKINVEGTYNVISASVAAKVKKFVFISSSEVYGLTAKEDCPLTEKSLTKPANNYALTKLLAENICKKFYDRGEIDLVIFRPFNHIGPHQSTDFVVSNFAKQIKDCENGIIKVGNLEAARDFSDVRDIVKAYRQGIIKGSGTYNLGSGKAVKIKDLLDLLIKVSGKNVTTEIDPSRLRAAEVATIYGDCTKAKSELGWEAEIPLEQSLKDIYTSL